jgi:hypothetical protein
MTTPVAPPAGHRSLRVAGAVAGVHRDRRAGNTPGLAVSGPAAFGAGMVAGLPDPACAGD